MSGSTNRARVGIGTTFRSPYADGNPLWTVTKSRGNGTWDCVVAESEPDWAGVKKVFGTEEIVRALGMEQLWKDLSTAQADFWASRKPGEVLHYHDAFGRYVRGTVVEGIDRDGEPAMVLRPTALVGMWQDIDLPRWNDAGFFHEGGYHVKKIASGETFQPNQSSIYESPDFVRPRGEAERIDPRSLPEIDLSHPEPTPAQAEAARLLAVLNDIRGALEVNHRVTDFAAEYRRVLAEVQRIVSDPTLEEEDAPSLKR